MDLSQTAIDDLVAFATAGGVDAEEYWLEVARFLDATVGIDNLTVTEEGWLDDAVFDSNNTLTWAGIVDILDFEPGVNQITGTTGNDTLNGTAGIDNISALAGNDTVNAGSGNDIVAGSGGTDTLNGEAGNDNLDGGGDADILDGGIGDDTVVGGAGNDTYVYTSGRDYYDDSASGTDKITLPSGIDSGDLTFYRANDNNLFITVGSLGDIEIYRHFYSATYQIETIEFYDTSTLNLTTLTGPMDFYGTDAVDGLLGEDGIAETIYGFGGDDTLRGGTGNDTLDGGIGNDEMWGDGGDDTFIMSAGFDEIIDSDAGNNTLVIPEDYTADDLVFIKQYAASHLIVQVAGLGQVTIKNQLTGAGYDIDQIYFEEDASTLLLSNVSIEQRGGDGNDSFVGITAGASLNDILNGMAGDDTLQGGSGNDTYVFSTGSDAIFETGSGTADKILFWEGWTPGDIDIYRGNLSGTGWDDLVVADQNGNRIVAESHFDNAAARIETVEFSDATVWTIASMTIEAWGGSGADSISALSGVDNVERGFGGNDTLTGSTANDTLDGGLGDDSMSGTTGNDTYIYSSGLDTVTDTGGTDNLWITGGTTINDITVSNHGTDEAKVVVTASSHEVIVNDLRNGSASKHVETIRFDDGFSADLPSYNSWIKGTSSGETVSGTGSADVLIGYDGNDTINAGAGADNAHGGSGNDTLHGDGDGDLLHGGTGNDTIYGDDGLDTLYGGSGLDRFMLEATEAFNNIDVIKDFNISTDDDELDLSDILDATAYNHGVDPIADWVELSTSGSDTVVKVDRDGTGGTYSMTQIATLQGITGLTDEAALVSSGNLIVA